VDFYADFDNKKSRKVRNSGKKRKNIELKIPYFIICKFKIKPK